VRQHALGALSDPGFTRVDPRTVGIEGETGGFDKATAAGLPDDRAGERRRKAAVGGRGRYDGLAKRGLDGMTKLHWQIIPGEPSAGSGREGSRHATRYASG